MHNTIDMKALIQNVIIAFFLLILVDLPWLMVTSPFVKDMIQGIQGSPIRFHYPAAAIVYVALAYLITRSSTPLDAFFLGSATYAVYDFTNLATIKGYSAAFALVDSLWGGILFAIVRTLLNFVS